MAFDRQKRQDSSYMPLIRQLNIETKVTAAWELAGLKPIAEDKLKILRQAIELRNSFVHYKWPAMSHDDADRHFKRVKLVAAQLPALVDHLEELQEDAFWGGRESEIMDAFRAAAAARRTPNALQRSGP
jgi:hypothetical protein